MTVCSFEKVRRRDFEVSVGCVVSSFCVQDLLQEVKQLKRKVEELEGEKGQYERKLRGTKVFDGTVLDPTAVCVPQSDEDKRSTPVAVGACFGDSKRPCDVHQTVWAAGGRSGV